MREGRRAKAKLRAERKENDQTFRKKTENTNKTHTFSNNLFEKFKFIQVVEPSKSHG